MNMMKRLTTMVFVLALSFVTVFATFKVSGNYFTSERYANELKSISGSIIGFDGEFLAIEFNKPIIKGKGDTVISSFLVDANGRSLQLKPLILPADKAKGLSTTTIIIFPVSDIIKLLEPKMYALEIYVSNSEYAISSIGLPLIPLDLSGGSKENTTNV